MNDNVIGKRGNILSTDVFSHPGEILADELAVRKIIKKDFAVSLSMQPSHLSDLLKGKRHISAKVALKLEQHLNINASYWLRVHAAYDLAIARKELQAV